LKSLVEVTGKATGKAISLDKFIGRAKPIESASTQKGVYTQKSSELCKGTGSGPGIRSGSRTSSTNQEQVCDSEKGDF
jgi:hypothetical protein